MPLRKHYLLIDGANRHIDKAAYRTLRLRHASALGLSPLTRTELMNVQFGRMLVPSTWRRDLQSAISRGVRNLRSFHSRKHARNSKSKLQAVRSAGLLPPVRRELESMEQPRPFSATFILPSEWGNGST